MNLNGSPLFVVDYPTYGCGSVDCDRSLYAPTDNGVVETTLSGFVGMVRAGLINVRANRPPIPLTAIAVFATAREAEEEHERRKALHKLRLRIADFTLDQIAAVNLALDSPAFRQGRDWSKASDIIPLCVAATEGQDGERSPTQETSSAKRSE